MRLLHTAGISMLLLMTLPVHAEIISSPATIYFGEEAPKISPLGAVKLKTKSAEGVHITEISALAWDQDEELLYGVTDQGDVHHLRPAFENGHLASVELVASYKLHKKSGKRLKGKNRDSEGVFVINAENGVRGDTELVISFERKPQITRFSAQGKLIGPYALPSILADKQNYRNANQMLEAVTLHPDKGILTIAQQPMKGRSNQLLHALSGKSWEYRMEKHKGNGVTAMEALPDGRILFLERAWDSLLSPLIVTLKEGHFSDEGKLELKVIATLDSSKGWALDNFEGLAHHRGQRFFMVSDDNKNLLQRTLLFYFEL